MQWSDGSSATALALHLRVWCNCERCRHKPTGQRLVNASDVDAADDTRVSNMTIRDDALEITWGVDEHKSIFPSAWLRANCLADAPAARALPSLRFRDMEILRFAFPNVMTSDESLLALLDAIMTDGIALIHHTPAVGRQVKAIAERIAPVSHSFLYGDVFDVVAKANPVNLAYTTQALKLHQDLAYYESPPGLQLLHALQFDATVEGGESIFADAIAAADALRQRAPQHFETLCRIPATFCKHHLDRAHPAMLEYQRPHIHVNHRGDVIAVHWSPPFEGPLRTAAIDDMRAYYSAYRAFHDVLDGMTREHRLVEGETVVFNQRRILHGRKAFAQRSPAAATRHLQGTYVTLDDALCRYYALRYRLRKLDMIGGHPHMGNANFH